VTGTSRRRENRTLDSASLSAVETRGKPARTSAKGACTGGERLKKKKKKKNPRKDWYTHDKCPLRFSRDGKNADKRRAEEEVLATKSGGGSAEKESSND